MYFQTDKIFSASFCSQMGLYIVLFCASFSFSLSRFSFTIITQKSTSFSVTAHYSLVSLNHKFSTAGHSSFPVLTQICNQAYLMEKFIEVKFCLENVDVANLSSKSFHSFSQSVSVHQCLFLYIVINTRHYQTSSALPGCQIQHVIFTFLIMTKVIHLFRYY